VVAATASWSIGTTRCISTCSAKCWSGSSTTDAGA
jgi:hypothetical protein